MEETAAFSGTVVNNPDASVPSGQIQPIRVNGAKVDQSPKWCAVTEVFIFLVDFLSSPSLQHLEKKLDLAQAMPKDSHPMSFLVKQTGEQEQVSLGSRAVKE